MYRSFPVHNQRLLVSTAEQFSQLCIFNALFPYLKFWLQKLFLCILIIKSRNRFLNRPIQLNSAFKSSFTELGHISAMTHSFYSLHLSFSFPPWFSRNFLCGFWDRKPCWLSYSCLLSLAIQGDNLMTITDEVFQSFFFYRNKLLNQYLAKSASYHPINMHSCRKQITNNL